MPDQLPYGTCDCHLHVYDPGCPASSPIPPRSHASDYAKVRSRLGVSRAVLVQPRPYGTDPSVLLEAVAQLGRESTRAVTVVREDVTESELLRLHEGGVRGVRFSLYAPNSADVSFGSLEAIAAKVRPFGWHLQLHWTADQIVEHRHILNRLPLDVVFDHLARLPLQAARHAAHDIVEGMIGDNRAWMKLSGPYLLSRFDLAAGYPDVEPIVRDWIERTAERLVWGSDWPHVDRFNQIDDHRLLALFCRWAETDERRLSIFVRNPTRLYDFPLHGQLL